MKGILLPHFGHLFGLVFRISTFLCFPTFFPDPSKYGINFTEAIRAEFGEFIAPDCSLFKLSSHYIAQLAILATFYYFRATNCAATDSFHFLFVLLQFLVFIPEKYCFHSSLFPKHLLFSFLLISFFNCLITSKSGCLIGPPLL